MRRIWLGLVLLWLAACSGAETPNVAEEIGLLDATALELAVAGSDGWLTVSNAEEVAAVVSTLDEALERRDSVDASCAFYELRFFRADGTVAVVTMCDGWLRSDRWEGYVRAPTDFATQVEEWVALLP